MMGDNRNETKAENQETTIHIHTYKMVEYLDLEYFIESKNKTWP